MEYIGSNNTWTSSNFTKGGSHLAGVTVTDSRGRTATASEIFNVRFLFDEGTTNPWTSSNFTSRGDYIASVVVTDTRGRTILVAEEDISVLSISTVAACDSIEFCQEAVSTFDYYDDVTYTATYSLDTYSVDAIVSEGEITATIPLEFINAIPDSNSADIKVTLNTYKNDYLLGTTTDTFTATVPDSVAPSVELICTPHLGEQFLTNFTKVVMNAIPTLAYGSKIVSFLLAYDDESADFTPFVTSTIDADGYHTCTATVTDTRGHSGTTTVIIEVKPVADPGDVPVYEYANLIDYDWAESGRLDEFVFEMLDPNDFYSSRGKLTGVIGSESNITMSMDLETRVGGSLKVMDSNYIDNSLIRIWHKVEAWNMVYPLGTYFVGDINISYEHDIKTETLTLLSMARRLADDAFMRHYTIASGTYTTEVMKSIFSEFSVPYTLESDITNTKYSSAVVYDFNTAPLTAFIEACSRANCEYTVDGYGQISVYPDIATSESATIYTIDIDSEYSPVVGSVDMTSINGTAISQVGVEYKDGDSTIFGTAELGADNIASSFRRGRNIASVVTISDMEPRTTAEASRLAGVELAKTLANTEYSFNMLYRPLNIGNVINLVIDNVSHTCKIKTIDNLILEPGLQYSITLEEE